MLTILVESQTNEDQVRLSIPLFHTLIIKLIASTIPSTVIKLMLNSLKSCVITQEE